MSNFVELTNVNNGKKFYINLDTVIRIQVVQGKTELVTNGIGSVSDSVNGVTVTRNYAITYYVQETPKWILEHHQSN